MLGIEGNVWDNMSGRIYVNFNILCYYVDTWCNCDEIESPASDAS
jgi:hypothetical protein